MNFSTEEIHRTARRLKIFRYCYYTDGYGGEPDSLQARYRWTTEAELHAFFSGLGITLEAFATQPGGDMQKLPTLVPGTRWVRPGDIQVDGAKVFANVTADAIELVLGSWNGMTEEHVARAEIIEKRLVTATLPIVDPPIDHGRCVSPKFYPELFR